MYICSNMHMNKQMQSKHIQKIMHSTVKSVTCFFSLKNTYDPSLYIQCGLSVLLSGVFVLM